MSLEELYSEIRNKHGINDAYFCPKCGVLMANIGNTPWCAGCNITLKELEKEERDWDE